MLSNYVLPLTLFFSSIPILAAFVLRETVRQQRRRTILELEASLKGLKHDDELAALPAFELVKWKYFQNDKESPSKEMRIYGIYPGYWVLTVIPFLGILYISLLYSITVVIRNFLEINVKDLPLDWVDNKNLYTPWIIVTGVFTGYLRALSKIFRAANNFDLSPESFIDGTIEVLTGLLCGLLFYFCSGVFLPDQVGESGPQSSIGNNPTAAAKVNEAVAIPFAASILFAFAASYYPDVARRMLVRASQLKNYKLDDVDAQKLVLTIPIDVLDGIDTEIRHRLEDFHVCSVQNLATANPLMLYVETPYNVFQIMDWVAQAQLCAAVGPEKFAQLRKAGIRTIFDLGHIFPKTSANSTLIGLVGRILFKEFATTNATPDDAAVTAAVSAILLAPHTQRLMHILNALKYEPGSTGAAAQ